MYNKALADKRGLSEAEKVALDVLYQKMYDVLRRPLFYFNEYKDAVNYVEAIEVVLQSVWKFDYNPNYQTYRFEFVDCICPKLDNQERVGTGMFIYDEGCPVHEHLFKREV